MEEQINNKTTKDNPKKSKKRVWLVLACIFVVALYLYISLRGQFLNILEVGENYADVFKQNLIYNSSVLAINFVVVFCFIYLTNRFIKKGLKAFFEEDKVKMPKMPNKSVAFILSALISVIVSPILTEKAILALNTAWFGINDPIFNTDIGYFFFQKPFIELLLYYVLILLVFIIVYTIAYYIIVFNVYFDGINLQTLKKSTVIKQLCTYIMLIAIAISGLAYISTQNILNQKFLNVGLGSEDAIFGAGLTDVTIKLWGYRILCVVIIAGVAMAIKFFRSGKNKNAIIALLSVPTYLILLFIIMTGFQVIFVKSNELDREKQYIAYNIENTKKAYNINIEEKEISNSGAISIEEVSSNEKLFNNIPIITKDVTLEALEENQTSIGYYAYKNINLANYSINNKNKLVYVSPREMKSDDRRTYNSKTYEYTHGYGVILSDATVADKNGNIEYIQKEFDGSDEKISISEPRIYFGLKTNSNIITNTKNENEFDYPITSSTNAENIYDGEAGLKLGFLDRLILGINSGDLKLAFNSGITKDTKIITNRNVIERAKTVMPNLVYDENPYLVIRDNGRLVWVLDAYTISNSYPYSQESIIFKNGVRTKINYIRNSVKVIVDAYSGKVQFYLTDRSDPVAMAYFNIYPNLFMPLEEEIPTDIQNHIVYPKYLYDIQAQMLTKYHNIQTEVLYRNDDSWSIAKSGVKSTAVQKTGNQIQSYYTMVKPANEEKEIFSLVIPYTPENKQNINAYLLGEYNGKNNLTLYKFKADDNVLGIMQLENQIDRDDVISKELESINSTGSKLIKNMIVVPINSTILYVEPIYQVLLNESQIPVLKKVIVASGNKVAIGDNLDLAIQNLLSQQAVELDVQNTDSEKGLIQAIIKANNNLEESSNNKDWNLIGKDIGKLQELIKQLEKFEEEQNKINNEIANNVIDSNEVDGNEILVNNIVNE